MDPKIISNLKGANSAPRLKAAIDAVPREDKYYSERIRDLLLEKQNLITDSLTADSVTSFLFSFTNPEVTKETLSLLRTPEIRDLIINFLAQKISGGTPVDQLRGVICSIVVEVGKPSVELYATPEFFKAILSCFHKGTTAESARWIAFSLFVILERNPSSCNKLLNDLPVVEAFAALFPQATSDDAVSRVASTDEAVRWVSGALFQILHDNDEAKKMFGTYAFFEKFMTMEKHVTSFEALGMFSSVVDILRPIVEQRISIEQRLRAASSPSELIAALDFTTKQSTLWSECWSSLVDVFLSKQHLVKDEESTTATAKFIKWCLDKHEILRQRMETYNILHPGPTPTTQYIRTRTEIMQKKEIYELFQHVLLPQSLAFPNSIPHVHEALALLVQNKEAQEFFSTNSFKIHIAASLPHADDSLLSIITSLLVGNKKAQEVFGTPDFKQKVQSKFLINLRRDPFELQELEQLRQERNDLRKLHQDFVTSSTKSIDDLKNQLQNEKTNHAATAADRDGKSKKIDDLENTIIRLTNDLSDEKQKSSNLEKSVAELSCSIQKFGTVNSQLDQEKQLSQQQKDELQHQEKAIADLKEKLEIAMKELEVEKKRPRIPRIKEGFLTLDRKNTIDGGSTATVYSTTYLDVPVAAKLYHPKIIGDKTIQRELKAAAHLKHPNIVSVISMIEDDKSDQVHGVLLELMGKDLSRHLKSNPQVSLRQRLQWLLEASQGIFCAHSLCVIHSDIKPGNILLTSSNPPIAKLADFGCAKILSTAAPSTMGVRGTASFISPEYLNQVTGATKQSDIFSLGMTIWTVLHTDVKDNPLGQTAEQMNQSVRGNVRPQIASDVPSEIKTLIEKCWNQDPAQRPNIEEVIQVLTQSVQQLEGQKQITFKLSPLWSSDKYLKNKHPNIGTLLNALKWSPGQDAKNLLFSNDIVDPLHPLFQFVASKFRPTRAIQKRTQYTFPGYQFDRKISRIQFVHPKSNIFLQLHDEDNQSRAANSYLNLQPTFFVAQQQKDALEKLKSFFEDPEISPVDGSQNQSRVLFAWNGTGAENVEKVCRDGPRGFRDTDAGFFGAGSYFAAEFDYCTKYSTGANNNGEFSVILYALSVSQAYPVTLEKDYRKIEDAATPQLHGFSNFYSGDSNRSVALMPRCDCHFIPTKKYYKKHPLGFFQVKERDGSLSNMVSDVAVQLDEQACNELDDEMTGHEIVLHSHTRVLPIAIVYFK